MNQDLIDSCIYLKPDILLLGKCELISSGTLKRIKENNQNIKIAKWFVDILEIEKEDFFEQFKYIDTFFQTAGSALHQLSTKYNIVSAYLPSISDIAFDSHSNENKEYDIIYIARDHKEDVRYKFAVELETFCKLNKYNLKIYGSLGNPPIFGDEYYREISKAKIAINFNRNEFLDRKNNDKIMESSDRMNQFLGVGTCTFNPEINEMDRLFKHNEHLVYFIGLNDCFSKIKELLYTENYKDIGKNGQKRAYEIVNSKRVTKYMVDVIFEKFSEKYQWNDYVFKKGEKLINDKL